MKEITAKCIMCARRDGCMDYSDETLESGVAGGHVPHIDDHCDFFKQGDESTRISANKAVDDFNEYAKNLIKSFNK